MSCVSVSGCVCVLEEDQHLLRVLDEDQAPEMVEAEVREPQQGEVHVDVVHVPVVPQHVAALRRGAWVWGRPRDRRSRAASRW